MGIPSYFSYIIRSHANIIRNRYKMRDTTLNSLYMDCNSIIYDAIRGNGGIPEGTLDKDGWIIQTVIRKIDEYVRSISPTNVLFIAFDGVAPLAKMNQQRNRRYKNGLVDNSSPNQGNSFNTAMITPGTAFMQRLSEQINTAFIGREYMYGVRRLVVSTSEEEGEGEHKMFQYIRDNAAKTENIAVYGLDSDLIMLSLVHHFYCNNIFIFREAPEFSKSVLPRDAKIQPNELLFMDIRLLGLSILKEMGVSLAVDESTKANRICDYIFMCFLLGNDFLPHFPALNIRSNANHMLLELYRIHMGAYNDRYFVSINPISVNWAHVKLFLTRIAQYERAKIMEELEERAKMEKRVGSTLGNPQTEEERKQAMDNIPILYRGEEKYINPSEIGWESRYYERVFGHAASSKDIQHACHQYLQGLEWVYRYYVEGCCNWRWKYDGHYAPLLNDIISYIPSTNGTTLFHSNRQPTGNAYHPNTQLLYVIPPWNFDEMFGKNKTIEKICATYQEKFMEKDQIEFQWMFCRYFWESHVKLPEIDIATLDKWNEEFITKSKAIKNKKK